MPIIIVMKEFWVVNKNCLALQEGSPRVPVSIHFDGDWNEKKSIKTPWISGFH